MHLFLIGRKFGRDDFQDMCRTLRVLNAVRQFEIGIPLSIQQFKVWTKYFKQLSCSVYIMLVTVFQSVVADHGKYLLVIVSLFIQVQCS